MIIKDVEIWYAKLDPKRPNATFDKDNPAWELQIRTSDKAVAKEWKELDLVVKPVRQKVRDDEGNVVEDDLGEEQTEAVKDAKGNQVYRVNLKKRSRKSNGEANKPVAVNAGDLSEIDASTIGNGSIANVRVFQYDGQNHRQTMLMAVQVTVLNEFKPSGSEDTFRVESYKVNKIADNQDEHGEEEEAPKKATAKKVTKPKPKAPSEEDMDDEIPF